MRAFPHTRMHARTTHHTTTSHHNPHQVIIGTNNMGQLHQCLQSARVTLDQGTLDAIDAIHFEDKNPNVSQ